MQAAGVKTMAKRGRPKSGEEPNTKAVKISRKLATRAARVAEFDGKALSDYLDEVLEAQVNKDFGRVVRETDPARKKGGE